MMEIRSYHWLIALSLATAIHLAFALSFERTPVSSGSGGGGGIALSLGEGEGESLQAQSLEALAALEEETAIPALSSEMLESSTETALLQPIAAQSIPALATAVAMALPVETEMQQAMAVPAPKKRAVAHRSPKKRTVHRTRRVKKSTGTSRRKASVASRGKQGSGGKGLGGTGSGAGSGKGAGSGSDYGSRLAAWLNKYKRYPRRAQKLGQQGTVKIRFTIDRTGKVLSSHLLRSSGSELLDREVRSLVYRASPMPPIPKTLARAKLTVTVPIRFSLN